ncbi:MAG: hypothetical protein QXQ57_08505 [Sulfolobales archaeon]
MDLADYRVKSIRGVNYMYFWIFNICFAFIIILLCQCIWGYFEEAEEEVRCCGSRDPEDPC